MKRILGTLAASLLLASNAAAHEHETQDPSEYLAVLCAATGDWSGDFEQYNEDGLYRTSRLNAQFGCQPGEEVLWETNLFFGDDDSIMPTLKVIFPDIEAGAMHMSYFYGGIEKVYFFNAT